MIKRSGKLAVALSVLIGVVPPVFCSLSQDDKPPGAVALLSIEAVQEALAEGARRPLNSLGLQLTSQPKSQRFMRAISPLNLESLYAREAAAAALTVFTPRSWVQRIASERAARYESPPDVKDIAEADRRLVLRVFIGGELGSGTLALDNIAPTLPLILTDASGKAVLRPIEKNLYSGLIPKKGGWTVSGAAQYVFDLDEVGRLRGTTGNLEIRFSTLLRGKKDERRVKVNGADLSKQP